MTKQKQCTYSVCIVCGWKSVKLSILQTYVDKTTRDRWAFSIMRNSSFSGSLTALFIASEWKCSHSPVGACVLCASAPWWFAAAQRASFPHCRCRGHRQTQSELYLEALLSRAPHDPPGWTAAAKLWTLCGRKRDKKTCTYTCVCIFDIQARGDCRCILPNMWPSSEEVENWGSKWKHVYSGKVADINNVKYYVNNLNQSPDGAMMSTVFFI